MFGGKHQKCEHAFSVSQSLTESDICPLFCFAFYSRWDPEPAAGQCQSSVSVPVDKAHRTERRTPHLCFPCPSGVPPAAHGTTWWTLYGAARVRSPEGVHRGSPAPQTPAPGSRCPWLRSRRARSRSQKRAALQCVTRRVVQRASPPCWRRSRWAHRGYVWFGAMPFWRIGSRRAERAPLHMSCGHPDWRRAGIYHLEDSGWKKIRII